MSNFYKIRLGDGVPGPYPHAKLHGCGFKKCGLTGAKIAEIGNFWYKFVPKVYLTDFYKIWHEGGTPRPARSCHISAMSLFKCRLTPPKPPKLVFFGINFPKMGTSHLLIFTKFGLGKGLPGPHCHAKFYRCRLKNVYSPKIAKTVFFGINLPDPKGKFWRSTEKVEYRYTTTNLPLCNDTITVLKITLLHSVSVITNFLIPKRDKKQTHKNRTLFRLQPARDLRSPPYSAW